MKELLPEISYMAFATHGHVVKVSDSDRSIPDMRIRSLSGVLIDPERHWSASHSETVPADCNVSEIADSAGEWTALAESREGESRKFLYFGDQSGFSPIFYSLIPETALIVSDTFSGVVQGVRRLGGKLTLHSGNYLTLISGRSTTFRNLISNETMANEIHMLGHDKALVVDSDSVLIIDRSHLSKAQKLASYEQALGTGIETASRSIERLLSSNPSASRAITLTGGADSRMVFALLLTTGRAKEFDLWTIDPRDRKTPQQQKVFTADVEIANQLRAYYKLEWMKPLEREKIALTYEESLAMHQSYNSNFAYTFKPSKAWAFNKEPLLSLRGGGGEILRGTGGARIAGERYEKYQVGGGKQRFIEWMTGEYLRGSFMTSATESISQRYLQKVLEEHYSTTLRESVDYFYRSTRNRGHFGHARRSKKANDHIMLALTNPYLVRAMELLDYSEKVSGKLALDLFDRTEPGLRDFPFENPNTSKQLMNASGQTFEIEDRHGWKNAFDKNNARARPTQYRSLWEPGNRREEWTSSIFEKDFAFISTGFERLLDVAEPDVRETIAAQQVLTLQNVQNSVVPSGSVSAKVASALDVFTPMPLDRPGSHFFTNPYEDRRIPTSSDIAYKSMSYEFGV